MMTRTRTIRVADLTPDERAQYARERSPLIHAPAGGAISRAALRRTAREALARIAAQRAAKAPDAPR